MDVLAFVFNENKPRIWLYVILIALLLSTTLHSANYGWKNGVILQVYAHTTELTNYKQSNLPNGNYFITGTEGELYWHPKSFIEALLLDTVGSPGGLNIFEIGLLCVFVVVFYFTVRGSGSSNIFSHNLYYGFLLIFLLISVSGSLMNMEQRWVNQYFEKITNGQFSLQLSNGGNFFYAMGLMLFFLLQFPKKALNMQKEQELTI